MTLGDIATKVKMCYPTTGRTTEECDRALRLFGGLSRPDKSRIQRFYSDTERGLITAARALGILCRQSQPGRSVTNSRAERNNEDVLAGARCLLAAAGLPECFWPYAAPYYCLMENLCYNKDGVRKYVAWAGEDFPAEIIPFGALIEYIPPTTRKQDHNGKWGNT